MQYKLITFFKKDFKLSLVTRVLTRQSLPVLAMVHISPQQSLVSTCEAGLIAHICCLQNLF